MAGRWALFVDRHLRWRDNCLSFVPGVFRDFDFLLLVNVAAAVLATYGCEYNKLRADPNLMATLLIAPAVFPLAFSIAEAHKRREATLTAVTRLQSSLWTLHAWHLDGWRRVHPGDPDCSQVFTAISRVFVLVQAFASESRTTRRSRALEKVYAEFRVLRVLTSQLADVARDCDAPLPDVVAYNMLETALGAFEKIRVCRNYATPRSARQFHTMMSTLLPLLLAPTFVGAAQAASEAGLGEQGWSAYFMAVTTAVVYSMFSQVQARLDNPFQLHRTHPDMLDLSRLAYYPTLSMVGTVTMDDGSIIPAEATLGGGPTDTVRSSVTSLFANERKSTSPVAVSAKPTLTGNTSTASATRQNKLRALLKERGSSPASAPPPPPRRIAAPTPAVTKQDKNELDDEGSRPPSALSRAIGRFVITPEVDSDPEPALGTTRQSE